MWYFRSFFFIQLLIILVISGISSNEPFPFDSLEELEGGLKTELHLINYKKCLWKRVNLPRKGDLHDVVIIGGGLSGLTAAVALFKEGVTNVCVYDESPAGLEGPWITCAKMATLGSSKNLMGMALDIPCLTFQAWYIAKYGRQQWDKIRQSSREVWMDYLGWYSRVMAIPVKNNCRLTAIVPNDNCIRLDFQGEEGFFSVLARKVVLAIGRCGFGEPNVLEWANDLSDRHYAHFYDRFIDYRQFKGKEVVVVGSGPSAADAALTLLEHDAKHVRMVMRRDKIPLLVQNAPFSHIMYHQAFYSMPDEWKLTILKDLQRQGNPPQKDVMNALRKHPNFELLVNTEIQSGAMVGNQVILTAKEASFACDFVLFATGPRIDGHKSPELSEVIDKIDLWENHLSQEELKITPHLGRYPYLGPSFEFKEKIPGSAPYLAHIYCFSHAAALSHGIVAGQLPGISDGAARLAKGIAADFFKQEFGNWQTLFPCDPPYSR